MKKTILSLFVVAALTATTAFAAELTSTDKLLVEAKKVAGEMKPSVLKKMIDKEEAVVVLDIRESEQRAEGEIYADETYAITRGNLEFEIENKVKDKNTVIVTYCRGGSRGALAAQTLQRMGYKNATNLEGGLKGWAQAGYPVETGLGIVTLSKDQDN